MSTATVITKTKDKLKNYEEFIAKGREWYSSTCEIKGVHIIVTEDLANDDETHIFTASIRWCYSMSTEVKRTFEGSAKGFEDACNWLDDMRVEFAKEILA